MNINIGKKMTVELVRSEQDPTVWEVPHYEWECSVCGNDTWVSYSNKSGVPNGKNVQLTGIGKYAPPTNPEYLKYRAYVQLWNDLYTGGREGSTVEVINDANVRQALHDGGIAHYYALVAFYGEENVVAYDGFSPEDVSLLESEGNWVNPIESSLYVALEYMGLTGQAADEYLANVVIAYGDVK